MCAEAVALPPKSDVQSYQASPYVAPAFSSLVNIEQIVLSRTDMIEFPRLFHQ
jgi:hypothetical protein